MNTSVEPYSERSHVSILDAMEADEDYLTPLESSDQATMIEVVVEGQLQQVVPVHTIETGFLGMLVVGKRKRQNRLLHLDPEEAQARLKERGLTIEQRVAPISKP